MKIGIIGSGDVGQTLGLGFATVGHDVLLGTRDPKSEKLSEWKKQAGAKAAVGNFEDAARYAEVAVLCTLWSGTHHAIDLAGVHNLDHKVVIDTTNPLIFRPGAPPMLALGHIDSGGEQVQRWLPGSRVVKAFNIVGHKHMFRPQFPGGPPDMFIAGNDPEAKKIVSEILESFGWPAANVTDIGGLEGARLLEPMCVLWTNYLLVKGSWNHAFKMLRR